MISRDGTWPARHAIIAASFLTCAIVLGGGGSPNPGTEVILQLVFAVAALAWLWLPAAGGAQVSSRSRAVWLVVLLALVVPALQLIPLPPGLWTQLGNQDDRLASLALVGREGSWQPWSHAPSLTLASVLAIIPALFAFVATASLAPRGRMLLVGVIAAMALVTAMLGAVQVSLGRDGLNLYAEYHRGVVTGFQANRNSAADVLLIGMVACAAFMAPALSSPQGNRARPPADRRTAAAATASALLVLLFAVVLTASRTGIALIPVALLGIAIILRPALADFGRWRLLPIVAAAVIAAVIALVLLAGETTLAAVGQRFSFDGEFRMELWRDAWFATQQAWPFGIGLGGAQPALIAAERLEILDAMIPNRVHNDYLELALEAGMAGYAALAAIVVTLAWQAWRSWRERPEQRGLIACGASILAIAALHSFVDYPLRSMALACLAGTGAGLLVAARRAPAHPGAAVAGSDSSNGDRF